MTAKKYVVVCPACNHDLLTRSEDKKTLTCFRCDTEFAIIARLTQPLKEEGGQTAADSTNEENERKDDLKGGRDQGDSLTSRKGGFVVDRLMLRRGLS